LNELARASTTTGFLGLDPALQASPAGNRIGWTPVECDCVTRSDFVLR